MLLSNTLESVRTPIGTYGVWMLIEVLRALAGEGNVAILGRPNIRYLVRHSIEGDSAVVYRSDTDECKVLVPLRELGLISSAVSKECALVGYSYNILSAHSYVLGRSFKDILIGFVKSFIRQGEELSIPFMYTDGQTLTTLSKYWALKDITRDIRVVRSKKSYSELEDLVSLQNTVKNSIKGVGHIDLQSLLLEVLRSLTAKVSGIYIRTLQVSENFVTLYIQVEKGIYSIGYRWSIPLSSEAERVVSTVDNVLERLPKDMGYGYRCADLVKLVKSGLAMLNPKVISVDVCGLGVEECEYPSTAECLYDNVALEDGMVLKIEVELDRGIYIPKVFVFREGKIEVY